MMKNSLKQHIYLIFSSPRRSSTFTPKPGGTDLSQSNTPARIPNQEIIKSSSSKGGIIVVVSILKAQGK
jgi:hypothetical protein